MMTDPASASVPAARESLESRWSGRRIFQLAIAVLWLIVFFAYFYTRELPNAQALPDGSRPTRLLVWEYLGTILLDDFLPVRDENSAPAGLRYLPQRIGFLAIGGLIYGLASLLGTGFLQAIGTNIKVTGRMEWHSLAVAIGLSGLSLLTLGLGLMGLLNRLAFGAAYIGIVIFWAWAHARSAGGFGVWRGRMTGWYQLKLFKLQRMTVSPWSPRVWGSLLVAPFLITIVLGAMLPEVDFDVKEYHFGGPKEYYLAGQIGFLSHNVYTSFPFLTEMLTLTGMVLYGDWYWGAIAGKTILAGFAPMTAILVGVIVRRWLGTAAGWLAAVVYLSIPWTYRISIIAYTEGGLCLYVAATLLATLIVVGQLRRKKTAFPCVLLTGFLAGSAAACKYPGLISVTVPIAIFLLAAYIQAGRLGMRSPRQIGMAAGIFVLGTLLSFGPWLVKNMVETGNPVYPLLYSVFGGVDWDPEMDAKWKRAHSPDHHQIAHLWTSTVDVMAINDWQSALVFGFGLIGIVAYGRENRSVRWVAIYLAWLIVSWWALTHRIDRFWVPLLPVASCLAGCGLFWLANRSRVVAAVFLLPVLLFNFGFITTELCGYNAYVIDLNAARRITAQITSPEVVFLNDYMQDRSGRVLSVGEAELFDATFPYAYNTVFDRSLLAEWTGVVDRNQPEGDWPLRPTDAIRETFRTENITEILVNWQEILRYRTTYGYTDYVTPDRFNQLVQLGLLAPPLEETPFLQAAETLSPAQRKEIETWAPELLIEQDGREFFVTTQIYPVM